MENYDASKRNSYIMYLDANCLYRWAMSQPLPTSNFKWLTDEEMEELDVMMVPDDSPRGYILEYDLGKYHYIHVYFIKCNVSFLHISDYPRDFTSVMFLSYVFQSTLMNFMTYIKITRLHLNTSG